MENLNKNIGERIAKLRKESNITQAQLAEKLNISIRHCSSIECGNARLSIEKLIEVADLFHVTLDYLILGRRFSKECIFNCNKRFKNLWLQFFLSQNQGFMRLFEKTVLK